jgi:hypothetical protein
MSAYKKLFGKKLEKVTLVIEQRNHNEQLEDLIFDYISPITIYFYDHNIQNE